MTTLAATPLDIPAERVSTDVKLNAADQFGDVSNSIGSVVLKYHLITSLQAAFHSADTSKAERTRALRRRRRPDTRQFRFDVIVQMLQRVQEHD